MVTETVTVGDTELQITETDDGFEVTEVAEDSPEGPFIAFGEPDYHGGVVPLSADFNVKKDPDGSGYYTAWKSEDDLDEGASKFGNTEVLDEQHDRCAWVEDVRIIEDFLDF